MMGRRPGLPDFRGTLTHDPILGSQASLTSPGALHGSLPGSAGGTGWWMPPHPHPHGIAPEYFTGHLPGSWLTHEHERTLGNHDRLEECLFPSARSRSSSIINGVNSSSVFGSGSGIFYPPPSSPQSMHSFVHQASPTSTGSKSVLSHWSSHGNHDGKGVLDLGDGRDLDLMPPRLNRKLSNCSEESNERDSELRPGDLTLHHRERIKDTGVKTSREFEKPKAANNFSENADLRAEHKSQPVKNLEHAEHNLNSQRPTNLSMFSENSNIPTQQNSASQRKNDGKMLKITGESNHTPSSHAVNSEPTKSTPPKLQKVKSGPPPRLQVPKSILNKTEGIVPTKPEPPVKTGNEISLLLKEEMLKSSTTNAAANLVNSKQGDKVQNVVSSEVKSNIKNAGEQGLARTSKGLSSVQKASTKPPSNQPRIPSGKPPLIAHFRDVKYNEDSSDDDSDSSNVSSGSESGSGSDDDSEEGEEGENGEDSSGSDTDSDGSDEEDDGGEQHDDDDDDDDDDVAMETQENDPSLKDSSHSASKRKLDESSSGNLKNSFVLVKSVNNQFIEHYRRARKCVIVKFQFNLHVLQGLC